MLADLHTHTTASDGELEPAELLALATVRGVTHLAITDHDTVAALESLHSTGSISLVPGIELSTCWRKTGVHVVGLAIDVASGELERGIRRQQDARGRRAAKIAARLVRLGLPDPLPAVAAIAGDAGIGRPHFARHLVAEGQAKDMRQAFRRYLGPGKAGDVRSEWASLTEVIGWIRSAGGVAVLAHPLHYGLTWTRLNELLADFRAAGGRAVEVVSGRQDAELTSRLAALAGDAGLLASVGSDFHRPGTPWAELGRCAPLPSGCRPVWSAWE